MQASSSLPLGLLQASSHPLCPSHSLLGHLGLRLLPKTHPPFFSAVRHTLPSNLRSVILLKKIGLSDIHRWVRSSYYLLQCTYFWSVYQSFTFTFSFLTLNFWRPDLGSGTVHHHITAPARGSGYLLN